MYNIKRIQEKMQKHGFTSVNDEQTKWNVGGGLCIEFIEDPDEPGFVLSHSGRIYFSRKFTVEEITSVIEVCALFGILSERLVGIYDGCTDNCEVVSSITLSEYNRLKEQASVAEDYDELKDSYKIAKENLERLVDENDNLIKQNRDIGNQYRRMEQDYQTYRRILNCIMSQFEAREIDW